MLVIQLPEKFLERLPTYVPQDLLPGVLNAFEHGKDTTFRVNTIKTTRADLDKNLTLLGFEFEHIPWYEDAYLLTNGSKKELMETPLYQEGLLYIQNVSSMIPPLLLDPGRGDTILDMAASPGSKTTQLAAHMENTGTIVANDKSAKRLFKLIANAKQQGVTNIKTSAIPGEFLWKRFPEYFDSVLVDVPCSMEGRITMTEPESYKDWSPRKIKELSNVQKWMLRSAVSCTKVGGTIIYSTCAMDPLENEEVIDWILKKMPGVVAVEPVTIPGLPGYPGLARWKHKEYDPQVSNALRIFPTSLLEGFFVAKLTKLTSTFDF